MGTGSWPAVQEVYTRSTQFSTFLFPKRTMMLFHIFKYRPPPTKCDSSTRELRREEGGRGNEEARWSSVYIVIFWGNRLTTLLCTQRYTRIPYFCTDWNQILSKRISTAAVGANITVGWLEVALRIRGVSGSNLGNRPYCQGAGVRGFIQSLYVYVRNILK
jgi:hypothetical protein